MTVAERFDTFLKPPEIRKEKRRKNRRKKRRKKQ
jgi:hypothetical protein